jgi:CHAT domain-containing protein
LFDQVIPGNQRKKLAERLEPERQKIGVAHVLLEKVIPWAALYDRKYDANKKLEANQPVGHDACLVALPGNDGQLPVTRCGQHPDCLLHAEQLKKWHNAGGPVLLPETVACPLHFWGFKHIVEVPPQQVVDGTGGGHPQQDLVTPDGKAQLVAGLHAGLLLEEAHRKALDQLVAAPNAPAVWKTKESQRDKILTELNDIALDLIYFYCHAYGGRLTQPEVWPPYLEFQLAGQQPGKITADEFDYDKPWEHHPLVFLNGCGTGAFTPDALSPFIIKLVEDRGAAGVIATEMPVWEALAGEMAVSFLREFLAGKPAGEALLLARRALLAQNNPLGLAYTLYAAEQLVLGKKTIAE